MTRTVTFTLLNLLLLIAAAGCHYFGERVGRGADPILTPYTTERTWAVAPFRNESGSVHANTIRIADHAANHLTNASFIRVVPMARVLDVMSQLQMADVATLDDAYRLMAALGVDGLVIGSVTAYHPYDPPRMGLTLELFSLAEPVEQTGPEELRALVSSATDRRAAGDAWMGVEQPVSSQGAFFDAADPQVRDALVDYAARRGNRDMRNESARIYHMSIDRYGEFVTYVMARRLIEAERLRLLERRLRQEEAAANAN